jgi:integrase/recombinase XerD
MKKLILLIIVAVICFIGYFWASPYITVYKIKKGIIEQDSEKLSERLVDRLKSNAYEKGLGLSDRFFPIKRSRGWQIIKAASLRSGFNKRVYPHLFRHSDAIERLRQTGNPKALQLHLGHSSPAMTLRYLSTLTFEDAIRVQQEVRFDE